MEQFENDNELLYMYRMQSHAANYFIQKYAKQIDIMLCKDFNYLTYAQREEIKQLALIKLSEVIDKYREDKNTSFRHYFHRVFQNLVKDYLRTVRREFCYVQEMGQTSVRSEVSDGEWWYYANQGKNKVLNNDMTQRLYEKNDFSRLFKLCTPIQKKILCLKIMGYSQKEIAKRLNKKEGSISYHMKIIRELHDNL